MAQNAPFYIVGTMSGTSLDGLDLALVRYQQQRYEIIDFSTVEFSESLHGDLCKVVSETQMAIDFFMKLNTAYTRFVAKSIDEFTSQHIDLISFSGQTIRHLPQHCATLQLGCGGILSSLTKTSVVCDFRSQDMGAGGQGAPLVPFVDSLLFADVAPVALLNIGGIANITYISADQQLIAFDTGPGNMVINALVQKLCNRKYDANGELAAQGKIDTTILQRLLTHRYFGLPIPKSTGRADFGANFVDYFLENTSHMSVEDRIALATELSAASISEAINEHCPKPGKIIVSGGGKHNETLMNSLYNRLPLWQFTPINDYGITEDAKEALAFAILGHRAYIGRNNHIPQATGADRELILGAIYHAGK
ncbi:anhydro-N-acetylmuramic acid kinase [Candidatus Uabimicrobium amorphum]|uniref:Anhydro-N-acetylmuramic acid kinase n=1 Tax=Uabimicrobium amorphum TaxID=2596890 RepID=A0A5S9F544_UABAM|nr:anhydro-N-acetylmuramic acid kinase [Candidatus Uabimicrobium amorphum]BBM85773.1 anhydro-N-acetylmuramic acid kinase [Candidatus Uabimicrobium amorphum]